MASKSTVIVGIRCHTGKCTRVLFSLV